MSSELSPILFLKSRLLSELSEGLALSAFGGFTQSFLARRKPLMQLRSTVRAERSAGR